jgi:hypothetical protein
LVLSSPQLGSWHTTLLVLNMTLASPISLSQPLNVVALWCLQGGALPGAQED